jgi:hypothetical protein
MYGDGTELDGIADLPTDRDKETRFRVQPTGYGNRVPGGTYTAKSFEKDTTRKKGRRTESTGSNGNNGKCISYLNVMTPILNIKMH